MKKPQLLTPVRSFHPSPSQLSCPVSPGCGTEWNIQSFAPVRASYARVSPGSPAVWISPTFAPTNSKFLYTVGGELYGIPRSTSPSLPKPGSIFPVFAFSAIIFLPTVERIRAGLFASPGQYATPRRDGAPEADS